MEGGQQQRPQNRIEDGFKDKHEKRRASVGLLSHQKARGKPAEEITRPCWKPSRRPPALSPHPFSSQKQILLYVSFFFSVPAEKFTDSSFSRTAGKSRYTHDEPAGSVPAGVFVMLAAVQHIRPLHRLDNLSQSDFLRRMSQLIASLGALIGDNNILGHQGSQNFKGEPQGNPGCSAMV